jgi:NhaP-type Na+/H+ or K+/H+ antiporter
MNFILMLGLLLILGLASTRLMKLFKLPNVTGFLLVGLIVAIVCLFIDGDGSGVTLSQELNNLNGGISSVALGFIALSIGEEFRLSKIKKYGGKIILITVLQGLLALILVDGAVLLACYLLNLPLEVSLCLGAIATATAPAATLMVIHQYKAKGPLVDLLLPVVAFDDALGLVLFSLSVSISKVIATGVTPDAFSLIALPSIEIFGSLIIGFVLGFLMRFVIDFFKSRNNHVIMIIAFTLVGVGVCELLGKITILGENLEFSSLLTCMMIGAAYENLGKNSELVERDFSLIERWTPALFMLFFVLSGAHLITSGKDLLNSGVNIITVIIVLLVYLLARSLGKYFGSFIGCKITKREKHITNYLGITLLPQAGVAIGMANQISSMEAFSHNGSGDIIVCVVLCATLVYELIGPLLTKWSLSKAGEIPLEDGTYPFESFERK